MLVVQHDTMSRQAYVEIRQAILQGHFEPGTKLVVRPLTLELGLSPTPIKVALTALAREGLVEAIPQRGYYVPTFDLDDIRDIYALRAALDRLAAELAANQPIRTKLTQELKLNLKEQRAAVRSDDLERYADLNTEFHRMIWEASKNGRLVRTADSLLGQIRFLVNTSAGMPGRPGQSLREHAEIARALSSGDASTAGQLVVAHAQHSEGALLERLRERGVLASASPTDLPLKTESVARKSSRASRLQPQFQC